MSPSWCTGDRPWHTHRVTTGCSVWLGPKQLRAPRPRSPVRPMGFLGWTSLLSLLPTTGRASPRGLRGARGLRVTVGSVGKERGALGSQSLCPRDRATDALCPREGAGGGCRGRGQHPAASHGCGHRRGSVVRWTLPGGRSLAHRLVPAAHTPGTSTDTLGSAGRGRLPVPFLPTMFYPKRHVPAGVGPVASALKREEKPTIPAVPGPRSSPSSAPGHIPTQPLPVPELSGEAHCLRPQAPRSGLRQGVPSPGTCRPSHRPPPLPGPAHSKPVPGACGPVCQERRPAAEAKPRARAGGRLTEGARPGPRSGRGSCGGRWGRPRRCS